MLTKNNKSYKIMTSQQIKRGDLMTSQQREEALMDKIKCLNEKNKIIALTSINTLYISQLSEIELGEAIKELMGNIQN